MKRFWALSMVVLISACALLAACDTHTHDWSMRSDPQEHWQICPEDNVEKLNSRSPHADLNNDGLCDTCGYQMDDTGGGSTHAHTFGEWKHDGNRHWRECSCGATTDSAPHKDDNSDGLCDVCKLLLDGAEHTHSWNLRYDETEHWMQCDCGETTDHEAHTLDKDGKCSGCPYTKVSSGEHEHSYQTARDDNSHWQVCSECGEETSKEAHTIAANYLCSCGYAYDAPAADGQETRNFWIIGTFTDDRSNGSGWGETHNDQWKFHRLVAMDSNGKTQYVFERWFSRGDSFKVVNDGGNGYWNGELNASHISETAKKYIGGNGTDNINFEGADGFYRITLHYSNGSGTLDFQLVYGASAADIPPHKHSYSTAWEYDETGHWHKATCEHFQLKQGLESHDYSNGLTCAVCGYVKPHVCVPAESWVQSNTQHWKNCSLCGRLLEETRADHSGEPCTVCGYELAIAEVLRLEFDEELGGYTVMGFTENIGNDPSTVELSIPSSYNSKPIVAIASKAFLNCTTLQTVKIPASVIVIDTYAFGHCSNLTNVTFSAGLKRIEMSAFEYTAITAINLPQGLEKIGNSAFEYSYLQTVTIPASVNYIGSYAFRNYIGEARPERPQLTAVNFEDTAGWKVYSFTYEFDPTTPGTDINVTNAATNAHNFNVPQNPYMGQDGYAQYIWIKE